MQTYYLSQTKTVRVLDWKTGRSLSDANQVKGYGWKALQAFPDAEQAYVVIVNLQREEIEFAEWYSREALDAWMYDLCDQLSKGRHNYHAGRHCQYCPHQNDCTAHNQWVRSKALQIVVNHPPVPSVAGQLIQLHESRKVLEKVCEKVRDAIASEVRRQGGFIEDPDNPGFGLGIKLVETTRLDDRRTAEYLAKEVGWMPEDIDACRPFQVGKVKEKLRQLAPHGQKKLAEQEGMIALDECGAVLKDVQERCEYIEKPLFIEEVDDGGNDTATAAIGHEGSGKAIA